MFVRASLLAGLVATAAVADIPDRAALQPLAACRVLADPKARLDCYDAAVDRLATVPADRAPGAAVTAVAPKAVRHGDERFIDSTLVAAVAHGGDLWTVRLADGSRWRTTQPGLGRAPQAGAHVRIRPGLVGGAIMQIGRGPKVHVMPVRPGG